MTRWLIRRAYTAVEHFTFDCDTDYRDIASQPPPQPAPAYGSETGVDTSHFGCRSPTATGANQGQGD